jgi:hypothetical protein
MKQIRELSAVMAWRLLGHALVAGFDVLYPWIGGLLTTDVLLSSIWIVCQVIKAAARGAALPWGLGCAIIRNRGERKIARRAALEPSHRLAGCRGPALPDGATRYPVRPLRPALQALIPPGTPGRHAPIPAGQCAGQPSR